MKPETAPITEDEWLIRLVWEDRVTDRSPVISPNAFEPRKGENDGISLFRLACLGDAEDALLAVRAAEKRPRYAIVLLPVRLLNELQLSVQPSPIATIPGHVVIPELNYDRYKANKASFATIKYRLALEASNALVRRPLTSDEGVETEGQGDG